MYFYDIEKLKKMQKKNTVYLRDTLQRYLS